MKQLNLDRKLARNCPEYTPKKNKFSWFVDSLNQVEDWGEEEKKMFGSPPIADFYVIDVASAGDNIRCAHCGEDQDDGIIEFSETFRFTECECGKKLDRRNVYFCPVLFPDDINLYEILISSPARYINTFFALIDPNQSRLEGYGFSFGKDYRTYKDPPRGQYKGMKLLRENGYPETLKVMQRVRKPEMTERRIAMELRNLKNQVHPSKVFS